MSESENKKRKRKVNYTLMLFVDSKEGRIRQMGIGPRAVESLAVLMLFAVVILGSGFYFSQKKVQELEKESAKQAETITKLEEENQDLVDLREELTDKVTILSDTINQKVEEEEALAQAEAEAHMPIGFPLSSSAAVSEEENEDKMVVFTGSEGNSVIASAAGTVVSITTDSIYDRCIKIDHGNGYVSIYRNNGTEMVKEGDEVVRGAILFVIGEENTELGYQIQYEEKNIDPMEFIDIDG
ncbi:MAG: M23 family metallopeptidase [Lachnospiraceae bacterium]|nr:M23 family metallopeptidase [Lachnospiraceae bacterium]